MRIRFLLIYQTCAFLLFFALTARAALKTDTWTGGTGSWNNASNWSLNVVPDNNNGSNDQYIVDIDGGNPAASAVLIDPSISPTVNAVILDANDNLTITNGATLTPTNGVTFNGTVTLTGLFGLGNGAHLNFNGTQTLGGNGQILLAAPYYDYVQGNGTLTIGSGITIHGAGNINGDPANPLVNQGTISADLSNQTLSVSDFVNHGQLLATNGGNLALGGSFSLAGVGTFRSVDGGTITINGTLVNTNNTFTLTATTGSLFLNGGTIQGGTVNASGGAQLLSLAGTLDGLTLNANLTIANGVFQNVVNGLTNNAVVTLASSGNGTFLDFYGTQTLAGSGQVLMTGTRPDQDHLRVNSNGTLTIGSGITIHGAGNINGDPANPLVNQGTISADLSNQTLSVSDFVNHGQLLATNGGTLYAYYPTNFGAITIGNASTLQYTGDYVQQAGSTVLSSGQLVPINGGSVLIQGGSLSGGGFLNVVVTNFGSIVPGPAASALVFASNLVLQSSSVFNFQLGGYTPVSQYGYTVLSNGVNLAGNLVVTLINGFVPAVGSSFTVLTSGAPITGGFANVTSGFRIQTTGGAGSFVYSQTPNSIALDDFQINPQPYLTWAQNSFGCTNCTQSSELADPDGDGMNNLAEFLSGFNPTNSAAYPHIISITRTNSNTDIRVTYLGANGDSSWTPGIQSRTNVLEYATGAPDGSYSTNNFVSTGQTNILSGGNGLGIVTNMVDHGGATNQPARYYRIEVIVP